MGKIRQCLVKNCKHDRPVTYHRMPKTTVKRNIWLDVLNLSETPDVDKRRVCSKHFAPSDFCVKGDGHIWLKNDAYPLQVDESRENMPFVNDESPEDIPLVNEVEVEGDEGDSIMDPLDISTEPPKQRFGEIYCDYMGALSFHCVLCPTTMDNSDEFILHYMIHFKDVFKLKQEEEYIEPIVSIVKLEYVSEPETIKEELQENPTTPIYSEIKYEPRYSDHTYASTDKSFGEQIENRRSKRSRAKNSEAKNVFKDNMRTCPSEPKICSICGKRFLRIRTYEKHILGHGSGSSPSYTCDICGKTIKDKKYLLSHMLTIHSEHRKIKVPCNVCGQEFDETYLSFHVSKHNTLDQKLDRKPNLTCRFCRESFLASEDLIAHILQHKKETIPCNVCGKTFTVRRSLADHQRKHTGERPFVCPLATCGKRFRTRNFLYVHRTTHWTGKNFACGICGSKFKNPTGVDQHKRKVHFKKIREKIAKIKSRDVVKLTPQVIQLNIVPVKQENISDTNFANVRTYSKYDQSKKVTN